MPAKNTTALLARLRELMVHRELVKAPLDAYIIPSNDAHNSEYIADCDQRRAFISGFDGSAGTAIVTKSKALMWTDGRYFIQAAEQMDDNWTLMKLGLSETPTEAEWINKNFKAGRVGVDPKLFTITNWDKLSKELNSNQNELVAVEQNLVDLVWGDDRPKAPGNPVMELPLKFAGKSTMDKLADIRKEMQNSDAAYLVVPELDQIAWLLNWRGSDIPYNPVFFAYVIVGLESFDIFIDHEKVSQEVLESLSTQDKNVQCHQYDNVLKHLKQLVDSSDGKVWLSKFTNYYLASVVPESRRIIKITPIAVMKAIKNEVEVAGMKACHVRDGAAVCLYLGWLEKALHEGEVLTEVSAASKLEEFRKKLELFMGLSFPTISGSGPNGAIVHYDPKPENSRRLSIDEMYLVDSGGQYMDGTTDITRTVHFGKPTEFQKQCFTRVLKGQINLTNSIFPNKLVGNYLDGFARKALWDVGLDYQHGTGHGIGHFLNVHEGPQGITWRPMPDDPGLQENMFLSNEPGYYHEGEFGIRLENIVRVMKASPSYNYGDRGYLTFEDVTLVPIQRNLIDPKLLSPTELFYLNEYHRLCRERVGEYMLKHGVSQDDPGYKWLIKETEPISGHSFCN